MAEFSYVQQVVQEDEHETQGKVDYFDQLPDPILGVILNKLLDAKSLCRCLVVSKRFSSLIPEVESISLRMNHPKAKKPNEDTTKGRTGSRNFVKNFVTKFLTKPLLFLQQTLLNSKKSSSSAYYGNGVDVFNWVGTALRNFHDVRSIKLELPCHGGEIGVSKNVPLLRWEASFGREMERCMILGATSVVARKSSKVGLSNEGNNDDGGDSEEQLFTDEELKLRIIWIISCLIASSGRHNLMKKMVTDCPKLSNAEITDAGKQGKLHMNKAQIKDLRESIDSSTDTNKSSRVSDSGSGSASVSASAATPASQMGYVGNLVMKLWYVKELELPSCGKVMKGATLVVIKPDTKGANGGEEKEKESDAVNLWGSFEGEDVFEEAAKELLRRKEKRVYRLEMNAF